MATEQVRLSQEAIDALKSYSPNHPLSTAILLMHKEVTTCHKESKQVVTLADTEWTHLEALLKKYSKSPVETKVNLFQTGTAVKQFGAIEPDEMLVEGRKKGEKV